MWLEGIERENYMHAQILSTLYNAHFVTDGVPWTAEDLIGKTNRKDRERQTTQDKLISRRISIASSVDARDESKLPDWARELAENRRRERAN